MLPNLPEGNDKRIPALAALRLLGPPHLLDELITTVLVGRDQAYLNQPWDQRPRDPRGLDRVGFLDFDISDDEVEALYAKGYPAAREFLSTWDWRAYLGASADDAPLSSIGGGSFGNRAASRSRRGQPDCRIRRLGG